MGSIDSQPVAVTMKPPLQKGSTKNNKPIKAKKLPMIRDMSNPRQPGKHGYNSTVTPKKRYSLK